MSDAKPRYHLDNNYINAPLSFGDIKLLQIGRRYCEAGEVIPAHLHLDWFELTVVTHGEAVIVTCGEETKVSAGDIYISFPCDIHEIRSAQRSRLEYDFFAFCCADGELSEAFKMITQRIRCGEERVFRDEKISDIVKNAISEFSVKGQSYSEKLLGALFSAVAVYLIRDLSNAERTPSSISDAEILCFSLMSYIDTHVYSIKTLETVAEKFNYNYSYLSKLFRKTTGKTLSEYYRHRKMEVARALILERKKRIGEIAEMLGYNLYSFSKAFKAEYGISPKNLQSAEKSKMDG